MTIVICATIGLQLLIFLCTVCRGDTFYIEPLVELESQDAFVDFYKDHALGLVLYTTVNCPECIDLQLRLREGVALFNETAHVEVPIAKITHDRNDITVRGLYYDAPHFGPSTPSLEVVRYGKLCRGRWRAATTTAEGIAGFLHLLSKAAYHNVSSDTDFPTGFSPVSGFSPTQRPVTDSRIVIAGYFLDGKDTSLWEDFKEAIEWYREQELVSIYVVSNPELMRQWRVDPPRIAVYNEATTGLVDWYGNLASETSVASFLSAKARPFVMVPWTTSFNDRDRVVTTMVMLFYQHHLQPQPDEDDSALDDPEATLPAESAACMDRVVQLLAVPLRKALHPTDQYAVGVRLFTKQVKRRFNVEARSNLDIPISTREGECEADVHVVVTHSGKPFSYKQPVLLSRAPHLLPRLVDFVGVVRGGERSEVAVRSQPASLTDMARIGGSGTVITMVALTFEKVIRRVNTISFVGLFSSSCRDECREPRALLRDLAYAFRHTPSVVIAEFDQSANDMPPQFRRDDSPSFFTIPLFVDWVSEWYDGPVTYEAIYQYIVSMTPDFDPHAPVPTRTAPPSGVAEARCVDDSKCEDELNDVFAEEEERDVRMQQARRWKGPTWQQRARR